MAKHRHLRYKTIIHASKPVMRLRSICLAICWLSLRPSNVAKMKPANTQHLVNYLQGWQWPQIWRQHGHPQWLHQGRRRCTYTPEVQTNSTPSRSSYMLFLLDVDVDAVSLQENSMHFLVVAAAQHRASRVPFYTLSTSWHSPSSSSWRGPP